MPKWNVQISDVDWIFFSDLASAGVCPLCSLCNSVTLLSKSSASNWSSMEVKQALLEVRSSRKADK